MSGAETLRISRSFAAILLAAVAIPAVLLASAYLPGTRFLPYFALLIFFWGVQLVPVALVLLAVDLLRKRTAGSGGALLKIVAGYTALMLGLGIYLAAWSWQQGSSRYLQVGAASPYRLTASTMAGFNTVTLGIRAAEAPGTTAATIITAPAGEIAEVNARASVGSSYSLRLIAASPDVTWTVEPGAGVQIDGERTIAPGTYRDYTVTTRGTEAQMQAAGSGACPLDRDPNDCSK